MTIVSGLMTSMKLMKMGI